MRSGRPRFPLKFPGRESAEKVDKFKNIFAGHAEFVAYAVQNGAVCVGFHLLADFCVGADAENFFQINAKVLPKVVDKNNR